MSGRLTSQGHHPYHRLTVEGGTPIFLWQLAQLFWTNNGEDRIAGAGGVAEYPFKECIP